MIAVIEAHYVPLMANPRQIISLVVKNMVLNNGSWLKSKMAKSFMAAAA